MGEFREELHPRNELGQWTTADDGGGTPQQGRLPMSGSFGYDKAAGFTNPPHMVDAKREKGGGGLVDLTPTPIDGDSDHLGGGINESLVIHSPDGDVVFKPVDGESFGARSGTIDNEDAPLAEREVLASRVDELVELGVVPHTAMVDYEGREGSAQVMIENAHGITSGIDPEDRAKIGILDAMIGNLDRHGGNALLDDDGKAWGIDHGYSFGKTSPGGYIRSWALAQTTGHELTPRAQRELAKKIDGVDWNKFLSKTHLDSDEREAFLERVNVVSECLNQASLDDLRHRFSVDAW